MTDHVLIIGNKRYSSWSLRGWLAVKLSNIEFEEIIQPLYQQNSSKKLKSLNPVAPAKVPSMLVDGQAIWDTLAICEYLAELVPEVGLWPEDRMRRAHARSVVSEMHSGFLALRDHIPMNLSQRVEYFELPEEVEADIQRIIEIWQDCREKYSVDGPYLFGKLSLADVFFAPVMVRLLSISYPLDAVCQTYLEAVWALPDFKSWRADAEKEEWTIVNANYYGA